MDKKKGISMSVIKRLPKYHRYLGNLMRNDVDRISSKELSEMFAPRFWYPASGQL